MDDKIFLEQLIEELEEIKSSYPYEINTLSKALTFWFLKEFFGLEDQEIFDANTDDFGDKGIDAIYSNGDEILIIQTKTGGKLNAHFPENDIILTFNGVRRLESGYLTGLNPLLQNKYQEFSATRANFSPVRIIFLGMRNKIPSKNDEKNSFLKENDRIDNKYTVEFFVFKDLKEYYENKLIQDEELTDELELIDKPYIYNKNNTKTVVASVNANQLVNIHLKYGQKIYSQNIRSFLGNVRINKSIVNTASDPDESKNFWFYNNGLVITCNKFDLNTTIKPIKIKLENFQVVNGCQTINSLVNAHLENKLQSDTNLLIKVIQNPDQEFVRNITEYTNSQSAVKSSDFISNKPLQILIHKRLRKMGYFYEHKRGLFKTLSRSEKISEFGKSFTKKYLSKEKAAQAYMAFYLQNPFISRTKKGKLLIYSESGGYYETITSHMKNPSEEILYSYLLLKLIEEKKSVTRRALKQLDINPANKKYMKFDWTLQADFMLLALFYYVFFDESKKNEKMYIKQFYDNIEQDFKNLYNYIAKIVSKKIMKKKKSEPLYSHTKYFKSEQTFDELKILFIENKKI